MYNRYIPQEVEDVPISPIAPEERESPPKKSPFSWKQLLSGEGSKPWKQLWSEEGDPLGSLLQSLKLEGVDSGDILLVLLILFLLIEGEDQWELIITLGLLLIMGLAEGKDS